MIAGFGYSFFSTNLWRQLGENADLDEFQNSFEAIQQPIHFEPGTNWAYSVSSSISTLCSSPPYLGSFPDVS